MANLKSRTASKKRDIHKFEQKLTRILNRIEVELSPQTGVLLKRYYRTLVLAGLSNGTKEREMRFVLGLSNILLKCKRCKQQIKDWDDVTREDVENFVMDLMHEYSHDGKESTHEIIKKLKIFFRWKEYGFRNQADCITEHGVGDPIQTRHVKKKNPDSKLRASDLITEEEQIWLLESCDHPMDAFAIDVGLDGDLRAGEGFNITLGDIKQDKYGLTIDVEGKTCIKSVRMINSTQSISKWLRSHPFKKDRNKSALISLKKSNYGDQ